ncbi:MAG: HlyD family efflux transporter periplasmic adaptor subunit [Xanthobacteraceae bacterium]|nr:HlyD family efflux transporter periplasmic adaptor subunit [Xanthobacteraceae bacterium]
MKKALMAILIVAAAATAGWYWWSHRNAGDGRELVLHGNVDIRQVALAFDGSGRITAMGAEEGDPVKAGQVIARLDTRTLEIQARQAEAQLDAQRQALQKLRNGSRPEEIAQVRAQLASAEATAERNDQDFSRATRLQASGSGAISQQNIDLARTNAQAANAKVAELRAALQLAEKGPRAEDIAAAEAQLKASEAQLAQLRHQIDLGRLRAPTDAVVRSRLREPGDMVTSQVPVFTLALTKPKWVRVYVGEPDLGKIKPGMAAQVFTDSHPDRPIAGKVGYISSVAEFTPKSVQTEELRTSLVYEVRVVVEDPGNVLRLGQPATVRLTVGSRTP